MKLPPLSPYIEHPQVFIPIFAPPQNMGSFFMAVPFEKCSDVTVSVHIYVFSGRSDRTGIALSTVAARFAVAIVNIIL